MADKRRITAIIDSIEQRKPDNDRGWGKYEVKLAGYDGVHKLDVPADINANYDLEEGFKVTLTEGSFKGWIVHSKSECFTGEPFPDYSTIADESPAPVATQPKTATVTAPAKKKSLYATKAAPSSSDEAPTTPKYATPKGGGEHTPWNQYQIDVRDPQIRQQEVTKIVSIIYIECIKAGVSLEDVPTLVEEIFTVAKGMDERMS